MVQRIWIPSPNYSSSRSRSQLLIVHTSEGATTFRNLGNFLAQPSSQVSYHCGFDDTTSSQIGEYVEHPRKSWSALNANDWGLHGCCCTPSGASSGWSRDTWLSKSRMLDACKAWLQEESSRYGIPLVKVNAQQINAGVKGVCGHGDVSAAGAGGGHTDPGPNFPWDRVVSGAPVPPSGGGGTSWPGRYLKQPPVMTGEDVRQWQQQMKNKGWALTVDGAYGPQSDSVCRSFQGQSGLAVDGIVGPQTWDASFAGGGAPAGPSPTPPPSAGAPPYPGTPLRNFTQGHGTNTWQQQMKTRGWTITVDDKYGGQSEQVCTAFQREKGLAVDGVVGPQTWTASWTAPVT